MPARTLPVSKFSIWFLLLALVGFTALARPAAAQGTTGTVAGVVRNPAGALVAGATVLTASDPSRGRSVVTGADGAYSLPNLAAGAYRLVASATGFADVLGSATVAAGGTATVDFQLRALDPARGTLRGLVFRASTRQPVPGAEVTVTTAGNTFTQITREDGTYRLASLPTGTYGIRVARSGFLTATASGVSVRDGQESRRDVSLKPRRASLVELRGKVRGANGKAVARARVSLVRGVSRGFSAITKRDGRYRITGVVPDSYDVSVTAATYQTRTLTNVQIGPRKRTTLNVALSRVGPSTARLEGKVLRPDETPIVGARIEITAGAGLGQFTVTNSEGVYRLLGLPAGQATVTASATGFTTLAKPATLTSGAVTTLDFPLTPGTPVGGGALNGLVFRSDTGLRVPAVVVTITNGEAAGQAVATTERGEYLLEGLEEGQYDLTLIAPGFRPTTVSDITVTEDETTTLDLQIEPEPPATLSGEVRDSAGATLANVAVFASREDGRGTSTTTDAEGNYDFTTLPAGLYVVRFVRAGFTPTVTRDVLLVSNETTPLNATLQEGTAGVGSVDGLAQDLVGRPVEDARIELSGPSGTLVTRTDASGRFHFLGLPEGGGYSAQITGTNLVMQLRPGIVIRAEAPTPLSFRVRFEIGTATFSGAIRASGTVALPGATLTVLRGPTVGLVRHAGEDGRYALLGLPPGTYVLEVRAPGYITQVVTVNLRAGNIITQNFAMQPEE
jgi:hypothetical protein